MTMWTLCAGNSGEFTSTVRYWRILLGWSNQDEWNIRSM